MNPTIAAGKAWAAYNGLEARYRRAHVLRWVGYRMVRNLRLEEITRSLFGPVKIFPAGTERVQSRNLKPNTLAVTELLATEHKAA